MIIDPETDYTNIHHKREFLQTVTPEKVENTSEKDTTCIIFSYSHLYGFQICCSQIESNMSL